ncbi:Murein DD-endopeptidase MepM and murein hydrolase activator NlpD, contain LysM domain [Methylophilus rhizosphaerae]|uniref:Murein DD-endopeptidase MepM and murein hydrolase activator NlpD, contain LysM domain n=1 Tax=Methylophilus rhizosphaerae TaxID=492660 RepID=A0A1G9EZG7_9PROT|nr:M23 family metallopeptidase [Methylophilus rhizosphaerae]SDK81458.1 Murein DD-endopeptidase MepM and murein hydrolase activator NlpD, contain LysM domain [Methylophilus rhizosphaerae]
MINIIIVSEKMTKPKTLGLFESLGVVLALILVPMVLILLFITPQQEIKSQGVKAILPPHLRGAMLSTQSHLDAYAKQIGELQARILRLDAQNQRLSKLAGLKATAEPVDERASVNEVMGQGGPLVKEAPLTEEDLKATIEQMSADLDFRDEYQGKIEAKLLLKSVLKDMLPNSSPINVLYNSSSYGWRIDPLNGHRAFHEGLDFPAGVGTPVYAAADGIVTTSVQTPDYGNLLKIDHGSGLETRYAHNSQLLVKAGERVVKGQKIALVGSTGRSTGPHLHYEIRLNGNPLDPREYLRNHS